MKRLIYGPVASRRLGHSLGVDLVPFKTCSYNCVYCQLGRTESTTLTRKAFVSVEDVIEQLSRKLKQGVHADYITLGGSGEPTLNEDIGPLIDRIKALTTIPVAVLTNGSLLADHNVREALMEADVVLPSLDAHDEQGFQKINRPHASIHFHPMVDGLIAFGKSFPGKIWLEVFILEGINASNEDARRFKTWIDKIDPDKVHVNTAVRPPAEAHVVPVRPDRLTEFCALLGPRAEVAFALNTAPAHGKVPRVDRALLDLLARRPCTLDDMAAGLGISPNEILKCIDPLLKDKEIDIIEKGNQRYYRVCRE